MAEKLYEYQGFIGRFHEFRDNLRDSFTACKEKHPDGFFKYFKDKMFSREPQSDVKEFEDYSHIYR